MITLDERHILLNASAVDKQDAIRQVGQLLVQSRNIEAGYITSMFNRERVANTYLGNGIAIPHGLPEDRDLIHETGVAVVQVPAGVSWNPGETVRLVVGIAARSDEHIDVLRRLTRVLGDAEQVARLERTTDPGEIIAALTGERPAPLVSQAREPGYAAYFDAIIRNKTGLHARPAASFVTLAKSFQSDIKVRHGDHIANGKSLVSLLTLGARQGVTVRVSAQGSDAQAALEALRAAIASGLGDEIEETHSL